MLKALEYCKTHFRHAILLVILLLSFTKAYCHNSIQIIQGDENYPLGEIGNLEIFSDTSGMLNFDEIVNNKSKNFTKLPVHQRLTSPGVFYWLKFTLTSTEPIFSYLLINKSYREVILFQDTGNGIYKADTLYFYTPLSEKKISNPHHLFKIKLDKQPKTFYLRKVNDLQGWGIEAHIVSPEKVISTLQKDQANLHLLLFTTFLIVAGNLLLYLTYRQIPYLFLGLTIVFLFIFQLVNKGIVYPAFKSFSFGLQYYTIPYALSAIFLLLFTYSFFKNSKYKPLLKSSLYILITLRLILLILGIIIDNKTYGNSIIEVIMLTPAFAFGIYMVYTKNKRAFLFILPFSILYLGYLNHYFHFFGEERLFFHTRYLFFNPINTFFSIVYIIYISYILYTLNKEKVDLLEKTLSQQNKLIENNEELKQLRLEFSKNVKQNTDQPDPKLIEISYLNQELNKDIEQLKKDLLWIKKTNLLKNNATLEEFKEIFPDESALLGLVAQVKWGDKFKCRKCGYNRYYEGSERYSRQCRSCSYRESATAHTVFDSIKGDKIKLLYTLYFYYHNPQYSIRQFSIEIEMRYATILDFIKKFKYLIADEKKKYNNWTSLIMGRTN